jgi:hypothetical protein
MSIHDQIRRVAYPGDEDSGFQACQLAAATLRMAGSTVLEKWHFYTAARAWAEHGEWMVGAPCRARDTLPWSRAVSRAVEEIAKPHRFAMERASLALAEALGTATDKRAHRHVELMAYAAIFAAQQMVLHPDAARAFAKIYASSMEAGKKPPGTVVLAEWLRPFHAMEEIVDPVLDPYERGQAALRLATLAGRQEEFAEELNAILGEQSTLHASCSREHEAFRALSQARVPCAPPPNHAGRSARLAQGSKQRKVQRAARHVGSIPALAASFCRGAAMNNTEAP